MRQGAMTAQGSVTRPWHEWTRTGGPARARTPSGGACGSSALGGGTGLSVSSGVSGRCSSLPTVEGPAARDRERLTAIVTAADDGGSSGRLRRAYGMIPPGDIRKCLLALSDGDPTLAAIFNFRFNGHDGGEVGGHSLGNLILTALSQLERRLPGRARAGQPHPRRPRSSLPASLDDVRLVAEFTTGARPRESSGSPPRAGSSTVRLNPRPPGRSPGPGSDHGGRPGRDRAGQPLHEPHSGPAGPRAGRGHRASRARVALVMNLMTEPGETDNAHVRDHVLAIRRHTPGCRFTTCSSTSPHSGTPHRALRCCGRSPHRPDVDALQALGCRGAGRELLAPGHLDRQTRTSWPARSSSWHRRIAHESVALADLIRIARRA